MPLSPKFPLIIGSPGAQPFPNNQQTQGYESLEPTSIEDQGALVKFHIKNILLTCPGENIGNLEMGCCLKQFLFAQSGGGAEFSDLGQFDNITTPLNGASVQEKVQNLIIEQLGLYAPYINVTNVSVTIEENTMFIGVSYFVNFTGANSISDIFDIAVDTFGNVQQNLNNITNSGNASFEGYGDDPDKPFPDGNNQSTVGTGNIPI